MKKLLRQIGNNPKLVVQLAVLMFLVLMLIVSASVLVILKPWSVMNNQISPEIGSKPEIKVDLNYEVTSYNGIETVYFNLVDSKNNEVNFSEGNIDLLKMTSDINRYLETVKFRVCSIAVVGSKLFIQVDTRDSDSQPKFMNVITVQDNIGVDDWAKVLEDVHSSQTVQADYLLRYSNSVGNIHYLYVYSPREDAQSTQILSGAILDK